MRLRGFVLGLGLPISVGSAQQPSVDIQVYHGKPVRMFVLSENATPSIKTGKEIHLIRPNGSKVCLSVHNANQVSYSYSVDAVVDTTGNQLPKEWQSLVSALALLSGSEGAKAMLAPEPTVSPLKKFFNAVEDIAKESEAVRKLVAAADQPGTVNEIQRVIEGDGIDLAQKGIKNLADSEGHIRHDGLATYIDKLMKEALDDLDRRAADSKTRLTTLDAAEKKVAALESELAKLTDEKARAAKQEELNKAKGERTTAALAASADDPESLQQLKVALPLVATSAKSDAQATKRLIDTYMKATRVVSECKEVKDGRNTFTLKFARKEGFTSDAREFGDNASVKVTVDAMYARPILELYPASFIVRRDDMLTYEIRDGKLQLDETNTKLEPRLGGMATITLWDRFNDVRSVAISAGIGTNVVGGEDPIRDLMLLGTVSYRDLFRVGLGWGYVPTKRLKEGVSVGTTVPDGTKVSDLMVTERTWDFAIMFSVTSAQLSLGKK